MRFFRAGTKPALLTALFRSVPAALAQCARPGAASGGSCGLWLRRGDTWVAEYWGFATDGGWQAQFNRPMLSPTSTTPTFFFVAIDTPRRAGSGSGLPSGFAGFGAATRYLAPPGKRVELYVALPGRKPNLRPYSGYAPLPSGRTESSQPRHQSAAWLDAVKDGLPEQMQADGYTITYDGYGNPVILAPGEELSPLDYSR